MALLFSAGCVGPNQARMREGNRRYKAGDFARAKESYGSLAVDLPRSPHVQGNLALAHYRLSEWAESLAAGGRALAGAERDERLRSRIHYNQGVVHYQQAIAEGTPGGERRTLLERSVAAFKEAVLADPTDLDAKYNYELVQRLLNREEERQNRENEENRDHKSGSGGDSGQEDQDDRDGKKERDEEQRPGERRDDRSKQDGKGSGENKPREAAGAVLTPEEAAQILKQAESLERFAIAPPGEEEPVEKDW